MPQTERTIFMGYKTRGKRNGSGPHKDSWQRKKTGSKGRRLLAGQKCPKGS